MKLLHFLELSAHTAHGRTHAHTHTSTLVGPHWLSAGDAFNFIRINLLWANADANGERRMANVRKVYFHLMVFVVMFNDSMRNYFYLLFYYPFGLPAVSFVPNFLVARICVAVCVYAHRWPPTFDQHIIARKKLYNKSEQIIKFGLCSRFRADGQSFVFLVSV